MLPSVLLRCYTECCKSSTKTGSDHMSGQAYARYAAAITYATLHTALDGDQRETFARNYAATAYPAPGTYYRAMGA